MNGGDVTAWTEQLLPDLKIYLGVTGDAQDDALSMQLDSALRSMELITGRTFLYGRYTEIISHYKYNLYLWETPIEEIESISRGGTIEEGGSPQTWKKFTKGGTVFMGTSCHCSCYAMTRGCCSDPGLTVVYRGGYRIMPADIKMALFDAIKSAMGAQSAIAQYGGAVKSVSLADVGSITYANPQGTASSSMLDALRHSLINYINPGASVEIDRDIIFEDLSDVTLRRGKLFSGLLFGGQQFFNKLFGKPPAE
jgi:hypothetical protein